jgi:hypothetical protein
MEGDGTDNVVRFPRNWIGPLEDLVPFGPAADRAAGADALRLAADPQAAPDAPALSADAFWGEDAGSIHAVLQPPRAGPGAPRVAAGPAASGVAVGPGVPGVAAAAIAPAAAAAAAPAAAGAAPRSEPTAARHATPWLGAALARRAPNRTASAVLTVLLALVVAALAASLLSRRTAPHRSLAVSTGAARARARNNEALDKAGSSAGDNKADKAGGYRRAGLNAHARREASSGSGASSARSHAAASKSAARAARRAELTKSGGASTRRGSSRAPVQATNTNRQTADAAAPSAAAVEPIPSSTYTQTVTSGVPVVSHDQPPAASGSSNAVSRSGESTASVDSASPLPVPGGPPAP